MSPAEFGYAIDPAEVKDEELIGMDLLRACEAAAPLVKWSYGRHSSICTVPSASTVT